MASPVSSYPKENNPENSNTTEIQENDLKSLVMRMIMEETNKIRNQMQEDADKQVRDIKEAHRVELEKLQENANNQMKEITKTVQALKTYKEAMEETQEYTKNQMKEIKKSVQDLKMKMDSMINTQTEEKRERETSEKKASNTEVSFSNRIQEMEERISGLEDTITDIESTIKENAKSGKLLTQNIQEIKDTMKRRNLRIIGIEEREDIRLQGPETILNKIIEENFPNLKKEMPINIQEAYRTPNRIDQKRKTARHIIIKTQNMQNKEKILKAAREKGQITFNGKPIRITPDFSAETIKARRAWTEILQTLRDHRCQARLLYPAKLSITIDGENKIFHDKNKFKQYLSTNPALQKVLEGKLHPKGSSYNQNYPGNR